MYDHIIITNPYPFANAPATFEKFCKRFGLNVVDEKRGLLHNRGYDTLEQNRGIYIQIETPFNNRKGKIKLSFSLHKYANAAARQGTHNHNDFTFAAATNAAADLQNFLGIDLTQYKVNKYETGINVHTTHDPELYMFELDYMQWQGRELRILEDVHFKEYKQYSTNKDKSKRIIYIFYDKTHEAAQKTKSAARLALIPRNTLRIEKDVHRPSRSIKFWQLFSPEFISAERRDFKRKFTRNLTYKQYAQKSKYISSKQITVIEQLNTLGLAGLIEQTKRQRASGQITRGQYDYIVKQARELAPKNIKIKYKQNPKANELKGLIIKKLNEM